MSVTIKILRNTLLIFFSKFIDPFISLVLVIAIARYLGADRFGEYSFIKSTFTIFFVISSLGLDQLITRDVARNNNDASKYLMNLGVLNIGFSFLMAMAMNLFVYWSNYPQEVIAATIVMSSALVAATLSNISRSIIAAYERFELQTLLISGENIIRVTLGTTALLLGYGLVTLISIITVVRFMGSVISLGIIHRKLMPLKWSFEFKFITRIFKTIPSFSLISIFSVLYWRIDVIMLSQFCSMVEVGVYTAAFRLMEVMKSIPLSLKQALFPIDARAFGMNNTLFAEHTQKSLKYLVVILLPMAAGTTIIAENIINLIYGNHFTGAIIVLRILVWTIVPYGLAMMLSNALIASGNQGIDLCCNVFGSILNILLNIILIKKYGVIGASIATLISILFFTGFQILFIKSHLRRKGALIQPSSGSKVMKGFDML